MTKCSGPSTTTCDLRGGCCTGVKTCRESKFLCATNTTETCGGERCLADSESSVCCPVTAQCCMSRGKIACCIETDVWWKWPALLASSAFLLLTLALLYYTYKSTRSSRRNDRHVIHYDDMPPVHPPPYHLHHGYLGVLMKEHNSNESPPEYVSREGTPHSLVTLPAMMRSTSDEFGTDHIQQNQTPEHPHDLSLQTHTSSEGLENVNISTVMSLSNLSDTDNLSISTHSELECSDLESCSVRTGKLGKKHQVYMVNANNFV